MYFENTGIEGKTVQFSVLEHIAGSVGSFRDGHWDYERATYDYKFENMVTGDVFYLRVPSVAIEGVVEDSAAIMKLGVPYIGKYYYPHGVEYEDEEFPEDIIKASNDILKQFEELLEKAAA